jgi:hypothetical protein
VKALALACILGLTGCISAVPVEPVTPANQAQVSGCQNIASTHNDLVVGGFVFGGASTALGAVSAFDQNPNDRTAYAISAAVVGALAAVDTAVTAFTSSEFANGKCSDVVGPLSVAAKKQ